ncbi:DUF1266 domain-containing protein [Tistrella mobilis]|uniref:DUF1266 domain-containing protein n=1 Tax=Tistrella mobilis TaxID=171437 RepID=UPI003555EE87
MGSQTMTAAAQSGGRHERSIAEVAAELLGFARAMDDGRLDYDRRTVRLTFGSANGDGMLAVIVILAAVSLVAGVVSLFLINDLALLGLSLPDWSFFALALVLLCLALWAAPRSGTHFDLRQRAVIHGGASLPFDRILPAQLELTPDDDGVALSLEHPDLNRRLAHFPAAKMEAAQAVRARLVELLERRLPFTRSAAFTRPAGPASAPRQTTGAGTGLAADLPKAPGRLTPVQGWIIGAGAIFARANGHPVDRLGDVSGPLGALGRRKAVALLREGWGIVGGEDVDGQVMSLITRGHREDFGFTARVAELSEGERVRYGRALHALTDSGLANDPAARQRALADLIALRYGPQGLQVMGGVLRRAPETDPAVVDLVETAMLGPLWDPDVDADELEPHWARAREMVGTEFGDEGLSAFDAWRAAFTRDVIEVPGALELYVQLRIFLHQLADPDFPAEELGRLRLLEAAGPGAVTHDRHMAWDFGRALMLIRWGHMAGWIDADDAWMRMLQIAREIQSAYGSWTDMAAACLEGRALWSGGRDGDQPAFEKAAAELEADPDSPWNRLPWDLPLEKDW